MIRNELNKVGVSGNYELQPIREKFGIYVFRVILPQGSLVGKYFNGEQMHGRNEIEYYKMLKSVNIPVLNMTAHTACLLLLEDIQASGKYRLATEQDHSNYATARLIARWFKQLHACGRNFSGLQELAVLDDAGKVLSIKSIKKAMCKSNTCDNLFWVALMDQVESIKSAYSCWCNTITYNDFWWDNMAVALDGSSALMFDYNCVYRGYAYSDIRHVLSVLSKEAGAAFLDAYGKYNNKEKAFDDLYFPLTGLISAYNMKSFPAWAGKYVGMLHSGEMLQRLNSFVNSA